MNRKIASALSVLALLGGCALNARLSSSPDLHEDPKIQETYGDLQEFYEQKLQWESCEGFECATIDVPLDYDKPEGKTISLSLLKVAASGEKKGTLFINPGGPGGSGIELAKHSMTRFSSKLTRSYDIVGFDPRGVGKSTPVDCVDDAELGKILDGGIDTATEAGREEEKRIAENIAKGCQERSGDLLPYVGTESAARDLDVMRELVGDEKLNYLGYSYGTELGGQYAELFPARVGRLVLDGAVNTQLSSAKLGYDQTIGFELAYIRYLEHCIAQGECPLGTSVTEARVKTRELLDRLAKEPLPTGKAQRPLNETIMTKVIVGTMYDDDMWTYLTQVLKQILEEGKGNLALRVADILDSREGDTFKDNSTEANWAITCADFPPSDPQEYARYTEKLKEQAVVFGAMQTEGTDLCSLWKVKAKKNLGPFVAKGSDPIVVIGTLYDPATPYSWAVDLNTSLENSVLISWDGDGHVAYGRGSTCIEKAVDDYFVDGVVPQNGLECLD